MQTISSVLIAKVEYIKFSDFIKYGQGLADSNLKTAIKNR